MTSAKWEFEAHKVTCFECHNVHEDNKHHIRSVMQVDATGGGGKLQIATKVEDNSLCLACHAGFGPFKDLKRQDIADMQGNRTLIAGIVQTHTNHAYEPERFVGESRCTECHMAKVASSGAPYDIASHTFRVIAPEETLATRKDGGMPNSCAVRCHRPLAELYGLPADKSLTTWNEESDVALAELLKIFYGSEGIWWKTK